MTRPSDDEYGSLQDLLGGDPDRSDAQPADSDADASAESDASAPVHSHADEDLPPGLPPEYAEAYRRGYERARSAEEPTVAIERDPAAAAGPPRGRPAPERDAAPREGELAAREGGPSAPGRDAPVRGPGAGDSAPAGRPPVAEGETAHSADDEPTQQIPIAALQPPPPSSKAPSLELGDDVASAEPAYSGRSADEEQRRKVRLAAAGLGVLALVLVLAAFGIGRLVADSAAPSSAEHGGSGQASAAKYHGPLQGVTIAGASATCQTANSVDAAGNPTTYEPAKAYDSDMTTAWRCDGSGQGQRFTISLPRSMEIAEVGLVPGYAKTDPTSGVDRYAENNRITKVRWKFDDGTSYVQRMTGDPADRSMRTMRIPRTTTSKVVIEVLASKPGPRNTIAISEVRIGAPAD